MLTRGLRALAAAFLVLVSLSAAPAVAQEASSVTATLLSQTAFTTNERTELDIAVAATNTGTVPVEDLAIVISFGPASVSRLSYAASLATGPSTVVATVVVPIDRTIDVGDARTLRATVDVAALPSIAKEDSRVYPLEIAVRGNGAILQVIRSAEVHIVREPEAPLRFAWWIGFAAGTAFGPDGTFRSPALAASLSPGGSLAARAAALRRIAGRSTVVEVVVQPSLLRDVVDMADGYTGPGEVTVAAGTGGAEAAAGFLADLRAAAAASSVSFVPLPMFAPTSPSLLAAGLGPDLTRQERLGADLIRDLLGTEPAELTVRPAEGRLDVRTLDRLAVQDRTVIVGDTETAARPVEESGFVPPPTATLSSSDGAPLSVVMPDPGTAEMLDDPALLADPVRGAQAVFGELALIWKEAPNPTPPIVRGLAMAIPDDLPPPVYAPLMDRVATAPFLARVTSPALVQALEPPGPAGTLAAPDAQTFSDGYVARILALRRDVDAYASMLIEGSPEPDRLGLALLQAEAGEFLGAEVLGAPWLDEAARVTGEAFASATPVIPQTFTFTSSEGTLPLRMGDPGDTPLSLTVRLESSQFDFPEGNEQQVTLVEPNQLVEFQVRAKASGRNPIRLQVLTPDGRRISAQTVVVRTTAVNPLALLITAGAAVLLVVLFARRWTRRRTT